MSEKLKPCPRPSCQSEAVKADYDCLNLAYVLCEECGFKIDDFLSEKAVITEWNAWNTRTEPTVSQWVSVSEKLPAVDVPVSALWNGEVVGEAYIAKYGKWCSLLPRLTGKIQKPVTHWQPLTEPPEK